MIQCVKDQRRFARSGHSRDYGDPVRKGYVDVPEIVFLRAFYFNGHVILQFPGVSAAIYVDGSIHAQPLQNETEKLVRIETV